MKIAMVDLKKQYLSIKSEIDAAVMDIIESTQFIMGKKVAEFEKGCSEFLDVKHAIGCASGRAHSARHASRDGDPLHRDGGIVRRRRGRGRRSARA